MTDLTVSLGPISLPNPVGIASGVAGFGEEYSEIIDISLAGALYTKAVTPDPRTGNLPPRLFETGNGLLNSIGLANPGLDKFRAEKLPFLRKLGIPFIVNVAGANEMEYQQVCEALSAEEGITALEINLSCPNVSHGGLAFGTDPDQVERLTASLAVISSQPLIVKLTPNVTDIAEIALAAEAGGATALSCINTVKGMAIDIRNKTKRIPRGIAGLSGPAIKPIGLAAVFTVSRAVTIPVIGIGGIINGYDAIEYLLAGADAIQLGTGFMVDPLIVSSIVGEIGDYMEKEGVKTVADIKELLR